VAIGGTHFHTNDEIGQYWWTLREFQVIIKGGLTITNTSSTNCRQPLKEVNGD